MSLPTDVPREVAERVPQPDFDAVLDRARDNRRRRRTTIAAGLAAAVVVAGAGFVVSERPGGDASPAPANPARTDDGASVRIDPGLPEGVRHLLGREDVRTVHVSAVDGAVAAFWLACGKPADPCRLAWTLRDGDEVSGDLLDSEGSMIAAVPGGWLVDEQQGPTLLLGPDGDVERVDTGDLDGDPLRAGDTAVLTHDGSRLLRDGTLVAMPEPPGRPAVGHGHVTSAGRLVAATSDTPGAWGLQATEDGRTWEDVRSTPPGTVGIFHITGAGEHVAAVSTGDADDRSLPVTEVLVSSDAGGSWTTVRGLDTEGADRARNAHSLAVSDGGASYLTTDTHGLLRITSDGDARPVPLAGAATSVFTTDDEVCVVVGAGVLGELRCSADDGATWAAQPLPGLG
jgi:hypothetical protein